MNVRHSETAARPIDRLRDVRFPYPPEVIPGVVRVLELVILACCAAGAFLVLDPAAPAGVDYYVVCTVIVAGFYQALTNVARLHSINALMRPMTRADDIMISIFTSFMLFGSLAFAFKVADEYRLDWLVAFMVSSVMALIAARTLVCRLLRWLSAQRMVGRNLAVLGLGEQSRRLLRRIAQSDTYFVSISGIFDIEPPEIEEFEGHPVIGDVDTLFACARRSKIDDVVVAMPWNADWHVTAAVEKLKELPVNVYLSTDLAGFELAFRPVVGDLSALPMFEVVQRPISGWSSAFKKVEDYALSIVMLIFIAPLMAVIALAIKIDSPGPIFFKQKRLGFNNKEFEIYKFRSMRHEAAPETVVRQADRDDPRVTRVGRFIRATSLDELPQLLNVLNGTMSIVGPRPHALSHNEEYGHLIRGYFARHRVKPGITGWAQVNGLRGRTETIDKMEARIRHDVYYAENWSVFFDLKIIVMTALVFLFQRSAY